MDALQFEKVTEADATAFYELRRAAILAGCIEHYSAVTLGAWTNPLTDRPFKLPLPEHFYFALIDNQRVASGLIDIASGVIDAICVHPVYFKRGIGKLMLQFLEQIARDHGLRSLTLNSSLNAVDFYRSQGFVGNQCSIYHSPRGVELECIPMTKHLPDCKPS